MAIGVDVERSLTAKFEVMVPHLDERQGRLYLASEARSLGHGEIATAARAAGVSRQMVAAGVKELEAGASWRTNASTWALTLMTPLCCRWQR